MNIIKRKGEYLTLSQANRLLKKLRKSSEHESFLVSGLSDRELACKELKKRMNEHASWTVLYFSVDRLPLSSYYSISLNLVKRVPLEIIGKKYKIKDETIL